ncbi:MAG: chemotaxis protein [Candidatus Magnetoovum sp. WYHC-5]|nr:chemotaxis protein [Candidatus Magnetoovum sp. WYHC-5]
MKDNIFEEIDQRTQLALSNQMEMLVFFLNDGQRYGINVFKIVEVIECPTVITKMPHSHPTVRGTIDFRGKAVVTIDLADFLGLEKQDYRNKLSYIIISEYNNNIQGFIVSMPDTLITRSWQEVKSPTGMMSNSGFLVAIAYTDSGEMIQILDIERILGEIIGIPEEVSQEIIEKSKEVGHFEDVHILVIDDSKTARRLNESVITQLGYSATIMESAAETLQILINDPKAAQKYTIIICDIEMPTMDGFTFTRKIRENEKLKNMYIMLHSSMSNPSNMDKAKQVGADVFIAKFRPDELAKEILATIQQIKDKKNI